MNKVALGCFRRIARWDVLHPHLAAINGEGQINSHREIIDSACRVVNGLSNPLDVLS